MQEYKNDMLIFPYDPAICIYAGECMRGLPSVFDVSKKPWIDEAHRWRATIEQVNRSPSGARFTSRSQKPSGSFRLCDEAPNLLSGTRAKAAGVTGRQCFPKWNRNRGPVSPRAGPFLLCCNAQNCLTLLCGAIYRGHPISSEPRSKRTQRDA